MKTVLSLSGGMDSTTLLGILLEQGHAVYPVIFSYGSKHGVYENKAAKDVWEYYITKHPKLMDYIEIDLSTAFSAFKSDLLLTGGKIPEGHYAEDSMKATVVPGRNTIFIAFLLGIAESIKANTIALGVHSGDHHIYPDCREEYIRSMQQTIFHAAEQAIKLKAPLLHDDKTSILQKGYNLPIPVPYHLTRTCYKDQPLSCGKCGSCQERLEAFHNINGKDSIDYAN